ncbi:hypothetical protein ACIU3Q_002197 [Salmonella enterica subsp. enterica serovar Kokomlemle]
MWWLKSELCCHWQHGTKNDQFIMLAVLSEAKCGVQRERECGG